MPDLNQIIRGNLGQKDIFYFTFLLVVVWMVLIVIHTTTPSTFTNIYVPFFTLSMALWILAIVASGHSSLKILPITAIGMGDLKNKFWIFIIVGVIYGIILSMGAFKSQSMLELSVPQLGVTDPAQNVFLSAFIVPIVEEMTTGATIMPSSANLIGQAGIAPLAFIGGGLSFFWFMGYNILSFIILISIGFFFRKQEFKNPMAIIIIAILVDALFFVLLHTSVYSSTTALDKLAKVFIYRVIADTIIVYFGSVIPVIIAHSLNNLVSVSLVNGVWIISPVLAIMPFIFLVLAFWIIKDIEKIKVL